ncbi:hypothetical protein UlMin_036000 [Ulmus minor]
MLSPTPFSLICALLLCLPLAIVFTITSPTNTTIIADLSRTQDAISALASCATAKTHQKINIKSITSLLQPPQSPPSPPPPSPPQQPDEDDLLFRVAARVNSRPLPRRGTRKLAFLFLTTSPLPFSPLWELYFNQTPKNLYNIYIHADPTYEYDPPFNGRFSPTLISAARRLLAHALLDDPSNAMFALISPSCIPIHSFNFTYKTLARSRKSFIEILENEVGSYDRWAARGEDAMLPEVKFEDFRIGSQFWVLTRKHARLVVSDRKLWSKFKLPCVREDTCYPEEHYFPTLLSTRDARGCVPATLTHVNWTGSFDGHPRTYESYEVGPDFISTLRKDRPRYGDEEVINGSDSFLVIKRHGHDPFLFARKFTPESIEPLMTIANDVIFRD